MQQELNARFGTLLEEGRRLEGRIGYDEDGDPERFIGPDRTTEFQAWFASCANLIELVALPGSSLRQLSTKLIEDRELPYGMPVRLFRSMLALLNSAKQEWDAGLLRKVEYIVAAATFDDFLDHAGQYLKGGRLTEAAVLASATLEDAIKKIASKNGVPTDGFALDRLLDELSKAGALTPTEVKRAKASAAVRNLALHAEWSKLTPEDVTHLVDNTRELIDRHI